MKKRLILVSALVAILAPSAPSAELPGMVFEKGLYGHDGRCAEVRRPVGDKRQACEGRVGVLATGQDTVGFMFESRAGDTVVFRSSSKPRYESDNDLVLFKTDDVLDLSTKLVHDCAGECRVESRLDGVSIECTAWKQADRKQTCASGRFLGNGMWQYQPQSSMDGAGG